MQFRIPIVENDRSHDLDTLATINDHLRPIDKTSLITGQIQTNVRNVTPLRETAQRHISNELLPVLRRIFHSGEHGEQRRRRQKRSDRIDTDIVRSILSRQTLGSLISTYHQHLMHPTSKG